MCERYTVIETTTAWRIVDLEHPKIKLVEAHTKDLADFICECLRTRHHHQQFLAECG